MSDRVFPWGDNNPTRAQRIIVALVIGVAAACLHYFSAGGSGGRSDFTILWEGSRLLLSGTNPYDLIGPGNVVDLPSPLYYPAPALVAIAPLTAFNMELAGTIFIFASSVALGYGATHDGWQRLPIFPSLAFMTSARLGQSSILMTAAVFIPMLAFFAVVKPQASLPVVASSSNRRTLIIAIIGALVTAALSFMLLPAWPRSWLNGLGESEYFSIPIATLRGFAIALVLLRWKRADAWLVFIAACMPQTWYPYNGLLLLTVATTFIEASVLSLVSSAGWFLTYLFLAGGGRSPEQRYAFQSMLIAIGYLPAVIAVLRKPNVSPGPAWMSWTRRSESRPG